MERESGVQEVVRGQEVDSLVQAGAVSAPARPQTGGLQSDTPPQPPSPLYPSLSHSLLSRPPPSLSLSLSLSLSYTHSPSPP